MIRKPVIAIGPAPERFKSKVENGYRYDLDEANRTRKVEGNLSLVPGKRSQANQKGAGGPDRRESDEGGHYIASRFNGSNSKLNHFAQDRNFNRSAYSAIENIWATELRAGKEVYVKIVPSDHGASQRPYEVDVRWLVDGL